MEPKIKIYDYRSKSDLYIPYKTFRQFRTTSSSRLLSSILGIVILLVCLCGILALLWAFIEEGIDFSNIKEALADIGGFLAMIILLIAVVNNFIKLIPAWRRPLEVFKAKPTQKLREKLSMAPDEYILLKHRQSDAEFYVTNRRIYFKQYQPGIDNWAVIDEPLTNLAEIYLGKPWNYILLKNCGKTYVTLYFKDRKTISFEYNEYNSSKHDFTNLGEKLLIILDKYINTGNVDDFPVVEDYDDDSEDEGAEVAPAEALINSAKSVADKAKKVSVWVWAAIAAVIIVPIVCWQIVKWQKSVVFPDEGSSWALVGTDGQDSKIVLGAPLIWTNYENIFQSSDHGYFQDSDGKIIPCDIKISLYDLRDNFGSDEISSIKGLFEIAYEDGSNHIFRAPLSFEQEKKKSEMASLTCLFEGGYEVPFPSLNIVPVSSSFNDYYSEMQQKYAEQEEAARIAAEEEARAAAEAEARANTITFKGKIDDKYDIVMVLQIVSALPIDKGYGGCCYYVKGSYYYVKNGPESRLMLSGDLYPNTTEFESEVEEMNDKGEVTGTFRGKYFEEDGCKMFGGVFVNSNGKEMHFSLEDDSQAAYDEDFDEN